jgi:alpha-glucosidase
MLILFFHIAVAEASAEEPFLFLGNVREVRSLENGLFIRCENGRVRVTVVDSGIVRIRATRGEAFSPAPSYAVVWKGRKSVRWSWKQNEQEISLETDFLRVRIRKRPCRFSFYSARGKLLNQDDPEFGIAWKGEEVYCFKRLRPEERFLGLGEKTGPLTKRGRFYRMWNSDVPGYGRDQDPLYQSHPFFMGVTASGTYGIFFDNTYRSYFNFGASNHRFYFFGAEGGEMDYYFIAGPYPKQVLNRYTRLVGRMPLPPLWSLGYQQCRYSYFPEAEVRRIAQTFREKGIPCDVIYLDIHYMDGYRVFTWHPERFPKPEKLLADLEAMGFKVVTIIDPGVKAGGDYEVDRSGIAGNHFARYPDGTLYVGDVWPGKSHFPDFTRPATRKWWGKWVGRFVRLGVDGFWTDMNEPAVWGQAFPDVVVFDDEGYGATHRKIHNVYGLMMARATYEGALNEQPNRRPFVLTRAGFSGVHRYAAVWTGDNIATFEHLEIGLLLCENMSLSGLPFIGTDVGGFIGAPTPELFARWIQFGTFTPLFRTHTAYNTPDQEPWSFGEEVEAVSRKFILFRYQMLPFLYRLFWEHSRSGLPVMRPLLLEFPEDESSYSWQAQRQFLLGKSLLVAPVLRAGQSVKEVYLPAGTWYDFWTGKRYSGRGTVLVKTPLGSVPLFARGGAILPFQRAVQYVGEQDLDTLIWKVYADSVLSGYAYLDDGITFEYRRGNFWLYRWVGKLRGRELVLEASAENRQYDPGLRGFRLECYGIPRQPAVVMWNGEELPVANEGSRGKEGHWSWVQAMNAVVVSLPKEKGRLRIQW